GPDADRDAVAGDGHPDDDLGQVVTVVFGLAAGAEALLHLLTAITMVISVVVAPVVTVAAVVPSAGVAGGKEEASLVAGDRLVGFVDLEVGGGGVEEQEFDFEVEQGSDLVVDLAFDGVLDLVQPVHRPIAGVIAAGAQAVYVGVAADPV